MRVPKGKKEISAMNYLMILETACKLAFGVGIGVVGISFPSLKIN